MSANGLQARYSPLSPRVQTELPARQPRSRDFVHAAAAAKSRDLRLQWCRPARCARRPSVTQDGGVSSHWEVGDRQGPPWRAIGVGVLIAGLILAAILLRDRGGLSVDTGGETAEVRQRELDLVVQAPYEAGERWFCSADFPVRAFSDGLAYPPERPGGPAVQERPSACYAGMGTALEAGFQLAPSPAGVDLVSGIYLEPTPSGLPAVCQQAATTLGYPLPCPSRLPTPGSSARCLADNCLFAGGFVIEARGFPVPPDWCDGCDAHVVIAAAPAGDRAAASLVSCDGTPGSAARPEEPATRFEQCPEGPPWLPNAGGLPHEGHTLTRWRRGGIDYAVSIEGFGATRPEVLRHLTRNLSYVDAAG